MNKIIKDCIEKVVEIFKHFSDKNENEWTFDATGLKEIISEDDFDSIENQQNLYEKNILLKTTLQKYFCSDNGGDNKKNCAKKDCECGVDKYRFDFENFLNKT